MMPLAAALLVALLLVGCAAPSRLVSRKAGGTQPEFDQDNYACTQESRTSWSGGGSGLPGALAMQGAKDRAQKESRHLYTLCMRARGYTVEEVRD
jgi:hypothetical protein